MGIEDQGRQGRINAALGRRDPLGNGLQDLFDPDPFLGRTKEGRFGIQTQVDFNLFLDPFDIGRRKIDFIDDRDDGQVLFQGGIHVGQGLGLNPLGGIDQKQDPFTGGQGPGDFIGKIHMSRGVDQVEVKFFPFFIGIGQGDGIALDGDAPFPFDVHGV